MDRITEWTDSVDSLTQSVFMAKLVSSKALKVDVIFIMEDDLGLAISAHSSL